RAGGTRRPEPGRRTARAGWSRARARSTNPRSRRRRPFAQPACPSCLPSPWRRGRAGLVPARKARPRHGPTRSVVDERETKVTKRHPSQLRTATRRHGAVATLIGVGGEESAAVWSRQRLELPLREPLRPAERAPHPCGVRCRHLVGEQPQECAVEPATCGEQLGDCGALRACSRLLLAKPPYREQLQLEPAPERDRRVGVLLAGDAHEDLARDLRALTL